MSIEHDPIDQEFEVTTERTRQLLRSRFIVFSAASAHGIIMTQGEAYPLVVDNKQQPDLPHLYTARDIAKNKDVSEWAFKTFYEISTPDQVAQAIRSAQRIESMIMRGHRL